MMGLLEIDKLFVQITVCETTKCASSKKPTHDALDPISLGKRLTCLHRQSIAFADEQYASGYDIGLSIIGCVETQGFVINQLGLFD